MATPLTASYRWELNYTVRGIAHKLRHYCKVIAGTGASGYDLVLKDGTTGIDSKQGAERLWTLILQLMNTTDTTPGSAVLQHLVGSAWQPLYIYTTAQTAASGTGFGFANQFTAFFRDSGFHPVKLILLESVVAPGIKATSFAAATAVNNLINDYTNYAVSAGVPGLGNWVVGRSNLYVASKISYVTDLNDKIRRRRGIA